MNRYRSILVTGATGFVGRKLVKRLKLECGPETRIFTAGQGLDSRDVVKLDLLDKVGVNALIRKVLPDLVVHLAAQSSVGGASRASYETWAVNLEGSLNLAGCLREVVPDCSVLFASSSEVYGAAFNRGKVSEATVPSPLSAYGGSKHAAEAMFSDVLAASATLVIARPTNHSGAGQDERFVLPSLARQIQENRNPVLTGNLSVRRDFLHVDDVVDAYISLLKNKLPPRSVFNIASGSPQSLDKLLQRMLELSKKRIRVSQDGDRMRAIDIPETLIDIDAIRASTGWCPSITTDQLLLDVLGASQTPDQTQD